MNCRLGFSNIKPPSAARFGRPIVLTTYHALSIEHIVHKRFLTPFLPSKNRITSVRSIEYVIDQTTILSTFWSSHSVINKSCLSIEHIVHKRFLTPFLLA